MSVRISSGTAAPLFASNPRANQESALRVFHCYRLPAAGRGLLNDSQYKKLRIGPAKPIKQKDEHAYRNNKELG